jgi:secreted trypsin-like serine protease
MVIAFYFKFIAINRWILYLGDSGGGVVSIKDDNKCMFVLLGITSYGKGCGFNMPAIYTRVSSYIDWIEANVWPNES